MENFVDKIKKCMIVRIIIPTWQTHLWPVYFTKKKKKHIIVLFSTSVDVAPAATHEPHALISTIFGDHPSPRPCSPSAKTFYSSQLASIESNAIRAEEPHITVPASVRTDGQSFSENWRHHLIASRWPRRSSFDADRYCWIMLCFLLCTCTPNTTGPLLHSIHFHSCALVSLLFSRIGGRPAVRPVVSALLPVNRGQFQG